MKKIYSFDVFDTCLVRACGDSANVFTILARKICGEQAEISIIRDFSRIRKDGEENARKAIINADKEEVTLEEIYCFCDFSLYTDIDKKTILQTELDIENDVLLPIYKTKENINKLHKEGNTIIYISDMYLPKSFIISILKKYDFYVNDQIVYVSSDICKTKQSGHLFDHIQKELGLSYNNWIHEGDNKPSDFSIPRNKGIKTILRQHSYNYYEKMAMNRLFIDTHEDINFIYSLSRALRLSMDDSPQNEFATNFVAPIIVPYVYYVLEDARKREIERLFFIARDGYILYLIAQVFSPLFPEIGIHYLYASRKSLYFPGLEELNYRNIKDIVPLDKGIKGILYALNIQDFDYAHLDFKGLDNEHILAKCCEDPLFIDAVKKSHQEQEAICTKYLRQEGLSLHKCAIVDMLGSRRCQKYMNNILRRNGLQEVFAYYFEVTWNRIYSDDKYDALNYQELFINFPLYHHVFQPLFEQYFVITDQERTIGYKEEQGIIIPIKEKDPINYSYKKDIFETNKFVCISFAKQFKNNPISNPLSCIRTAQYCFGSFCHNPPKKLLESFNQFFCTDGNNKYILLQKSSLIKTIINHNKYFRWLEGNLVYNSGCLYKIIRLILSIHLRRKIDKK